MPLNRDFWWTRRRFLQVGVWSAGWLALARLRVTPVMAAETATRGTLQVLTTKEAETLTMIVERLVDCGDAAMPNVRETGTILTIDQALLQLDADLCTQFRWLLPIFDWSPPLLQGKLKRFRSMSPAERDAYLRVWAESRFATCRLAFRALKNLAMLGYYSQDETWAGIHYYGPMAPRPRRVFQA